MRSDGSPKKDGLVRKGRVAHLRIGRLVHPLPRYLSDDLRIVHPRVLGLRLWVCNRVEYCQRGRVPMSARHGGSV